MRDTVQMNFLSLEITFELWGVKIFWNVIFWFELLEEAGYWNRQIPTRKIKSVFIHYARMLAT